MSGRYAFATLVTSDRYLPGALAVVAALKEVHPSPPTDPEVPFQTVCIVTPETVDVNTIRYLRKAFDVVVGVEVIQEQTEAGLQLLGRPDLHTVLTKLHVFRLTQYEKVIFLDADVLPVRPLSHLFTIPHEFSAVPDVGWPDIFNSGVMVLTPGEDKFNDIRALVKSKGSWDGGDQGVLNEWRGSNWNRLSFIYNTTPTAAYTYAPAYERFGSQISALHFIGPNKPWNEIPYRAPSSFSQTVQTHNTVVTPQTLSSTITTASNRSYAYSSLVDRWFDVYDRNYRQQNLVAEEYYETRKYENAWDEHTLPPRGFQAPLDAARVNVLGLEDLRKLAVEGSNLTGSREGEGEYRSLPLDGRIDLMQPKRQPQVELKAEDGAPPLQQSAGERSSSSNGLRISWHGQAQPLMQTLPTPGPNEVPPSPHFSPISLPSSGPPTPKASVLNRQVLAQGSPPIHSQQLLSPGPSGLFQLQAEPSAYTSTQTEPSAYPSTQTEPSAHLPTRTEPSAYLSSPAKSDTHPSQKESNVSISFQTGPSIPSPLRTGHDVPPAQAESEIIVQSSSSEGQGQQQHHMWLPPPPPSDPPRPPSPPLLSWNPAIEPPPNVPPTPSAFPSDAYFPNVWDIPRSSAKLHAALTGSPQSPSTVFFKAPPPGQIPRHLIQEGHYVNVMGPPQTGLQQSHSLPDISKVASVFPWEERPRHIPGRVFPEGEITPTLKYIEKMAPEPEPERSVPQIDYGRKAETRSPISSPPSGFPGARGYSNAWDSVPSIKRYAARLAAPSPALPILGSPRARPRSDSYKSRTEQSDASSMDGDVEDEVDDDDSDAEENSRLSGGEQPNKGKSRSDRLKGVILSPPSGSSRFQSGKKGYRSYGVQTVPKDVRSIAVQVSQSTSTSTGKLSSKQGSKHSSASSSPVTMPLIDLPRQPSAQEMVLGMEQLAATTPGPASAQAYIRPSGSRHRHQGSSPGMLSPRLHDAYTFGSPDRTSPIMSPGTQTPAPRKPAQLARPPALITQQISPAPLIMARASSTDTADSPLGPVSPTDSPLAPPPRKPVGRTWNPATGVDVFKRGSEEVLARFLRMGSWEDESQPSISAHK